MKTLVPVLTAALALSACAVSQPRVRTPEQTRTMSDAEAAQAVAVATVPGQCFKLSQMGRHRVAADDSLHVRIGRRDVYRFDMDGPCLASATGRDLLLRQEAAGSDTICRPSAIRLTFQRPDGTVSQCVLKNYTLLSPRETAALPRAQRP